MEERVQRLAQTEETLVRTRSRISILEQQLQIERSRCGMVEDKCAEEVRNVREESGREMGRRGGSMTADSPLCGMVEDKCFEEVCAGGEREGDG